MARKYEMSWDGAPNYRWVRMRKGKRYKVTCEELRCPKTKEESYQAANEWWKKKVAELSTKQLTDEQAEALNSLSVKLDWAANNAPELLPQLEQTKAEILQTSDPDSIPITDQSVIEQNLDIARLTGVTVPDDLDPTALQHLFGDRRIWQERLAKCPKTEANRTVGYQLERHLEEQRTKQQPATHAEYRAYLKRTLKTPIWSEKTAIDTIDEDTVRRHYLWLVSQKFGPERHNKLLGFFRRFIVWLDSNNLLSRLPKNLKLREHRKKPQHKAVRKFDGVKEVVNGLASPYRLWALLGLNCGMTEADLGETTWEQINTKTWVLTRRRAKTGDNPNSPTVRYKLWPETIKDLEALPRRSGLLFTTQTGQPLYSSRYDEQGSPRIKDLFKLYWNRLDPKPAIPLGKFRSIGATALRANNLYRTFDFHFLADVPQDIASKHYSAENDAAFFEALDWIRQHLGFADKEAS